jgi:hypothetical protein
VMSSRIPHPHRIASLTTHDSPLTTPFPER